MIEYLLLLQIPFYIIAAGVWYIALTLRRSARKKKTNLDKLPPEGGQGGHY
jgi:hypothetical protein